jgi:bifunctional DNA-binding transcriptional regulator/antitoxin component of YhaV-PrlF toxin-antitoxin module
VIPSRLRKAIGVQVGDVLVAWTVDGVLTLVPLEQISHRLRSGGKPSTRSAVEALLSQRRMSRG